MSFRIAEKEAKKSKHKQHKLGAVIVKGGNIVATGYNEIRPSKTTRTPTLHAEAAAIKKLLDRRDFKSLAGSTMYVTRFTRGGSIGLARPCDSCMALVLSVGIRTVIYSTVDGFRELKL
jgi:deoxycytidylate deaminase